MKSQITKDSVIVVSNDQISCDLAGESVILEFKSSMYYGLNETATDIWELIRKPISVNEIINSIKEEYGIDPKICEEDILKLLEEMNEKGLIEIKSAKVS